MAMVKQFTSTCNTCRLLVIAVLPCVFRSRYLYQPMLAGIKQQDDGSEDDGDKARTYKRYLLSDTKNFECLFFPEKPQLLKLVDDFREARGKFAIPGFPNKLGILLDGPPGTGKTSLIKALAIYLQRHIVSVSLEKLKTNQELMDMMFDLSYSVTRSLIFDHPIAAKPCKTMRKGLWKGTQMGQNQGNTETTKIHGASRASQLCPGLFSLFLH